MNLTKSYKMKSLYALYISGLMLFSLSLSAQETTLPAGGDMGSNAASASYSIGQVFFTPIVGSSSQRALQGVQQPYEWFEIETSLPQARAGVSIRLFPNPSTDWVYVEQTEGHNKNYRALLYDGLGKIIKELKIQSQQEVISVGQLPEGLYYLKVIHEASPSQFQTFKIVKK